MTTRTIWPTRPSASCTPGSRPATTPSARPGKSAGGRTERRVLAKRRASFDRAAADFPRSDYRPMWLYWSGRAHEALGERTRRRRAITLEVTDYANTYHGRLARQASRRPASPNAGSSSISAPWRRAAPRAGGAAAAARVAAAQRAVDPRAAGARSVRSGGRRAALRADGLGQLVGRSRRRWPGLLAAGQRSSPASDQFGLYRGAINAMKRAYPHYLAAGGEELPRRYPRRSFSRSAYWDLDPEVRRRSTTSIRTWSRR